MKNKLPINIFDKNIKNDAEAKKNENSYLGKKKRGSVSNNKIFKTILKFVISIIGVFLVALVLNFIISEVKKANEDPIVSATNKSIKRLNLANKTLNIDWEKKENSISDLLIYTNDTAANLTVKLYPNFKRDNYRGMFTYITYDAEARSIERFLNKKDTLGYRAYLEKDSLKVRLSIFTNVENEINYNVCNTFFHTEKEKKMLLKLMDKKKKLSKFQKRMLRIDRINERQVSFIDFSEEELKKEKLEGSIKNLFYHKIDLKNPKHLFYFTSNNSEMKREEFKLKTVSFKRFLLKKEDTANCCFIRKVKITLQKPTN
ncbi:hypothetical protein [Polaribacter sp. Q13]|uniref:hypothetical protein n=1 Tax=Polaribacter sp. Q13 TaxID=2806551 RepID=UPI00193B72C1|nr:hypothetical protein [Polaribacter sp. Q13]QVY67232.1 hypothetical protein JOP69_08170 [Polaribacter sp. Q13]